MHEQKLTSFQIDNLRLAIPRIIEPFHRPTNPTTFKQYAQGVIGSQNGIKNLSEQWKSPEIQDTFDHIKKSFAANADLSACSSIPSYGWCERERHIRETKQSKKSDDAEDYNTSLTYEDVPRILVEFQKAHPKIKLETQEDNGSISVRHPHRLHAYELTCRQIQFVSGSVKFKFLVNLEREASDRHKITAECSGRKEPLLAITRCIASRPKANDLGYLLVRTRADTLIVTSIPCEHVLRITGNDCCVQHGAVYIMC